MYNISLKVYSEPKSTNNLSKKSILRYTEYRLKKVFSKKFLEEAKNETFSIVINQRNGISDVKLVSAFRGKNITITVSNANPYKAIQDVLNKFVNKSLKINKMIVEEKRKNGVKYKENIKNGFDEDFYSDIKVLLEDAVYITDSDDLRITEAKNYEPELLDEESDFLKLIEEYSALM